MRSIISDKYVLMALITFGTVFGVFAEMAQAADANLNMVFTTTNAGGSYGNSHVHVVWIKDTSGNFVYTSGSTTTDTKRAVWANSRAYALTEWYNSNPTTNRTADIAARTGATQTVYKTYNLNWNWRKKDGSVVPDGDYQIHFLCTNSDSGSPRNKTLFNITKGPSSWSIGPVSQGGYNNISLTFTPAGLGVIATAATNITSEAATLNGQITSTGGGTNPDVYIYWGDTDGGTVSTNWEHVINLGTQGLGDFSANVTGLIQGTTYYYTCYAVNSGGSAWSASTQSFTANSLNTLFAEGDIWKYFKGTTFPGSTWNTIGFNDSGWLTGPTGIGYGDGDDATVLTDMQNNYWTVYMRKNISVDVPEDVSNMTFTVDYDDGFVAFINGTEVARRGVAVGQNQNTPATSHDAGTPEDIDITAFKTVLVPGENVFAIEVHNTTLSSSDLSMIPEMTISGGISEPAGRISISPAMLDFENVTIGSNSDLVFDITNTGNDVLEVTSIQAVGLETDVYSVTSASVPPFTVQPAGIESITVRFSPRSVQEYKYAQLAIGSNDSEKVAYLALQGTGGPNTTLGTRPVGGIGGPAKALAKYDDKILLGRGAMLVLLDVSNPASPSNINQIRLEGVIEAITVQGDVAYAALGNKGFTVVNLNDFKPLLGATTIETGGFASDIDSDGSTLCIADGIAGTHIYNISTPLEPVLAVTYETTGIVNSVKTSGGLLYILDESEGIRIFELGSTPVLEEAVAHWKLDEMAGSIASDSSLNGHNGTLMHMDDSDWVSGNMGNALAFDGTDDYVQVSGYKGIIGTASRTCMAWIKTASVSGEILTWGEEYNGGRWVIRVNEGGQLRAEVQGGNIIGTTVINNDTWHHVAVVIIDDGSPDIAEAQLYVDGQLETVSSFADEPINSGSAEDVKIGAYLAAGGPRYFQGLIDDVRIYTEALTSDKIGALLSQMDYDGIEFGTRILDSGQTIYTLDSFGNLSILDASGSITLDSETILQVGSARDIEVQNGYAYVIGQTGLEVLDVSASASPASSGLYSTLADPADIVVDGTVAYVADGSAGLEILDVSNPAAVSSLGSYSLISAAGGVASDSLGEVYVVGNQQNLADYNLSAPAAPAVNDTFESLFHAEDIEIEGQYAFVAAGLSGLNVFDLSNSAGSPAAFATSRFATAVSVNGSTAMVCDSNDVYVLDVSSPMSPSLIGSLGVGADGWASDVAVGSTHGYVAEGGMGISILDLSTAQYVGSYPVAGLAYGVAIDGEVLYVACGTAGLTILDVSNPASPSLIEEYDMPGMIVDVAIVGDRLCVADATYGVSVLDVSTPAARVLYAKAATSSPAFHISSVGSRILVADKKGGLAVLGVTNWPKIAIGDIINNSQVDLDDLVVLADQWLSVESNLDVLEANLNYYDTTVNLGDFSVLSEFWLSQY